MESEHVSTALLLLCYRMNDYSLHCDRLLFLYYIDYVKYVASKLFKCNVNKIFFMLTSHIFLKSFSPSSPSWTLSFFFLFLFLGCLIRYYIYILSASMSLSSVPWLVRRLWNVHLERTDPRQGRGYSALCH